MGTRKKNRRNTLRKKLAQAIQKVAHECCLLLSSQVEERLAYLADVVGAGRSTTAFGRVSGQILLVTAGASVPHDYYYISIITTGIIIIIAIIMVSYNGHHDDDNVHGRNDRVIAILTVFPIRSSFSPKPLTHKSMLLFLIASRPVPRSPSAGAEHARGISQKSCDT